MAKKFWYVFDKIEEIILVVMFVALVAITFAQVVLRFCFNTGIPWSEEGGKYLFVWLSWMGISIGAKHNEHIKIEMFHKKLPFRAAKCLNILNDLIVIAICAVVGYYGVVLCNTLIEVGIQNTVLGVSQAVGTSAVPVGCFLMIIRMLQSIWASIRAIKIGAEPLDPIEIDKTDPFENNEEGGNG